MSPAQGVHVARAGPAISSRAAARKRRRRTRRLRIAVVTGTRAEYGLLQSTLRAIVANPRLELRLIVTGMHLLTKFGRTIDEIRGDGWRIAARIPMQKGNDSPGDQAEGLARGVAGISRALMRMRADAMLVLGDRVEAMAGALAAVAVGVKLAHVHGGDVAPGDVDGRLRDAISMLADIHFPATARSARRLRKMGVATGCIKVAGRPGLDRLFELAARAKGPRRGRGRAAKIPEIRRATRRQGARRALIVQHAYGRAAGVERRTMQAVLSAVKNLGLHAEILCPNSDRGHAGVFAAIRAHAAAARNGDVVVHRSLPRDEFLRRLIEADVLVGNSSSGIIEAPAIGVPVVNVGTRQAGREPSGRSIVHAPETERAICAALRRALRTSMPRPRQVIPKPRVTAGQRIAAELAKRLGRATPGPGRQLTVGARAPATNRRRA